MTTMAEITYTIWIGGNNPWGRCYLAELQTTPLTSELAELDNDTLADKVIDWDDPLKQELEDGCVGWGAYTDQMLGVAITGDEENTICLLDIEEMMDEEKVNYTHHLPSNQKGKHLVGCLTEKGGYGGELTLPADEPFDPSKLKVDVVSVADEMFIVNGATYGDIDIYMEGDTDGKGSDYYVFENDCLERIY